MKTAPDTIGQEHLKALRLNRPLLPIEQFAVREGTTVEEIEKCSNIGIVQLRRHNGKTYVVDIPVCSYEATTETDAEVARLIGKTPNTTTEPPESKIVEHKEKPKPVIHTKPSSRFTGTGLFKNLRDSAKNIKTKLFKTEPKQSAAQIITDNRAAEAEQTKKKQTVEPGSISALVSKMVEKSQMIKQHLKQDQQQVPEAKKEPDDISQITEQLVQSMHSQLDQMETAAEKSGILLNRNDKPQSDTKTEPGRDKLDKPRENQIEQLKVQLRQIEQELGQARKQHSETTKRLNSQIEELSELLNVMGRSS